MPGITVTNSDTAGGTQLGSAGAGWEVEGETIVLQGDSVAAHPPCPDSPIHCAATMAEGSSWFSLDGVPVCAEGHAAVCGHVTTGRSWFDIEA